MSTLSAYWEAIALELARGTQNRHPKTWKKADIKAFLVEFIYKVRSICVKDERKACLLLNVKPGKTSNRLQINSLDLSYDTFRNIFQVKKSSGRATTKHMFAIYFGYDSFQDYLAKNKIENETKRVKKDRKKEKVIRTARPTPTLVALMPIYLSIISWMFRAIIVYVVCQSIVNLILILGS